MLNSYASAFGPDIVNPSVNIHASSALPTTSNTVNTPAPSIEGEPGKPKPITVVSEALTSQPKSATPPLAPDTVTPETLNWNPATGTSTS